MLVLSICGAVLSKLVQIAHVHVRARLLRLEARLLLGGLLLENASRNASTDKLLLGLPGLVTELRDHLLLAVRLLLLLRVVDSAPLEKLTCMGADSLQELVGAGGQSSLEATHRSLKALVAANSLVVWLVLLEMIGPEGLQCGDGSGLSIKWLTD